MSIATQIARIIGLRNRIRNKLGAGEHEDGFRLIEFDPNNSNMPNSEKPKLQDCADALETIQGTQYVTDTNTIDVTNKHYAQINDPNLIPTNIKNGVKIFGVMGTYDQQTPTISYDPNNDLLYGSPEIPANFTPDFGQYQAFSSVDPTLVNNSIRTLKPENIKEGVTIMGVQGTYDPYHISGAHGGCNNAFPPVISDNGYTITIPLYHINDNSPVLPTELATDDIQYGWICNYRSPWHPDTHGVYYVVAAEFGKQLYNVGHLEQYITLDVFKWNSVGADRFFHLVTGPAGGHGGSSKYEIIYQLNPNNVRVALLKIKLDGCGWYTTAHNFDNMGELMYGEIKWQEYDSQSTTCALYHVDIVC